MYEGIIDVENFRINTIKKTTGSNFTSSNQYTQLWVDYIAGNEPQWHEVQIGWRTVNGQDVFLISRDSTNLLNVRLYSLLEVSESEGDGSGLDTDAVNALIKSFARTGSTTPAVDADLAPDGERFQFLQIIQDSGLDNKLSWSTLVNTGFHSRIFTEPTPAQQAVGGNLATNGGVVFVQVPHKPVAIWVRYGPQLPLVLFTTLDDGIIRPNETTGQLPPAADNIGRIGVAGNHFYRSVGELGTDKAVGFANYGPTRTGTPARSNDENYYLLVHLLILLLVIMY